MSETLRLIASRRSHRAYESTQLTSAQLEQLVQAALESPSAVNRQPWHFTVVQNEALLNKVNEETRKAAMKRAQNERSPRFSDAAFHVFYHAPTVIFISAEKDAYWGHMDSGIAVQNIVLAAESLGLGSVIIGMVRDAFEGENGDQLKKELCFPAGHAFAIAVALGVPTDQKDAHPVKEQRVTILS